MITLPHGAGEREAPDIESMTRPPLAPLGWFCQKEDRRWKIMRNGNSTFSAVDCIENLTAAGFTPEQARAQAKEFENSRIDLMAVLATKQDIEQLRSDTEQAIKTLGVEN